MTRLQTPSRVVERVLDNVYDISREQRTTFGERIVAVLYSWFYGSIVALYFSLTDDGREKSFIKWCLASSLVTGSCLLLLALAAGGLHAFNLFLWKLLDAGLVFGTVMVSVSVVLLGGVAICTYN